MEEHRPQRISVHNMQKLLQIGEKKVNNSTEKITKEKKQFTKEETQTTNRFFKWSW